MKATTSRQLPIEEVNTLDIEKTKSYYNQIRNEDLCGDRFKFCVNVKN